MACSLHARHFRQALCITQLLKPSTSCFPCCPLLSLPLRVQVVEQGPGQYFCEYDGTTLSSMVRRYIFNAKVVDESGECTVQVFNEQVSSRGMQDAAVPCVGCRALVPAAACTVGGVPYMPVQRKLEQRCKNGSSLLASTACPGCRQSSCWA